MNDLENSGNIKTDIKNIEQNQAYEKFTSTIKKAVPETPDAGKSILTDSEMFKREREMTAQDNKLLAELDEVLEKHSARTKKLPKPVEQPKIKHLAQTVTKSGVGFISLSLVLIFLGIMLLYSLFSPRHDFLLVLKLSPICLVLVGLEIFLYHFFSRGRIKINVPSILISAFVMIACCVLSLVFNEKFNENNNEYNNRSIAADIYDLSYDKLKDQAKIAKLDVKVDLNPAGSGKIDGISSLSTDDYVDITVNLSGIIDSPGEFARICKNIIDIYNDMKINVTNFYFKNESTLHSYNLSVEGKFAQDSSREELEKLVNHIYIRDMDYLQDLEDLTEDIENKLN